MQSALVREGDDSCECLTVEVTVGGYGPLSGEESSGKYWSYLDREVMEAEK